MGRTLVIGDIHGGYKALQQVMERAGLGAADRLIFLGDYVDGWSQSSAVIDYLIDLERGHECVFILGNHDAWCLEWLSGGSLSRDWLFNSGETTIASYRDTSLEGKMRHLEVFKKMRLFYEDDEQRLFIHAGFTSQYGPAYEHIPDACFWDRTLWEMVLATDTRMSKSDVFYPKRLLLYDEIFIGHTPTTNYDVGTPMHKCNVWNLDTGAGFRGRLTVMDADIKQYWQSDVVQQLYPGEKGRNK
ncbi:MAG TPA: metallophosphoesterase family protein [Puia sp.]|nr:metallophosphoesterase family protein [Puia sp.]